MIKEIFENIPQTEQLYNLLNDGKELIERRQDEFAIKLFSICDLFVEIWYSSDKKNVEDIIVFDHDEIHLLYEGELKIPELTGM